VFQICHLTYTSTLDMWLVTFLEQG
jgi:hypothetical protein